MPTLLAGRASSGVRARRGVTLIEMMIVVALIALMAGISFPAVSAGVETLRLNSAADDVVGILNAAVNRAGRRQSAVEVTVSREGNFVMATSAEPGFERVARFPETISIVAIAPAMPYDDPRGKRFLVYPGGAPPRIAVVLANRRGDRRHIMLDPITGVAAITRENAPGLP